MQYMDSPFYQIPMWDAEEYHRMALSISKGSLPDFISYRPPLYPLFLGIIYMIFGSEPLIPRIIQILIGVFSCVLVQRIGTRLFGPVSGFFSGIAASFTGLMIYYDLELLPTSLFIFLILLMIDEMLRLESGSGSALKTGLWFGLGCLCRPTLLTFLPVAVFWLWRGRDGKKNTSVYIITAVSILLLSTIAHVSIRSGSVVVSAQGGVNFLIGNNTESDGMTARLPGFGAGWSWDTIENWAKSVEGKELNPSQVDRVFWKVGFSEIKSDIGGFLGRTLRKAGLFWNRYEISSNRDLYYHGRSFPLIGFLMNFGFVTFLPFALMGFVMMCKSRNIKLIGLVVAVYYLSILPFFVNARFRHPLTPFLIVLAIGSVGYLIKQIREKTIKRNSYLIIPTLIIGIVLPFSVNSGVDPERWDYGFFTEGKVLEQSGRFAEAEQKYIRALEHNPRAPYVNYHLAELMRNKSDLKGAIKYYRNEVEIQPQFGKGWNDLGISFSEMGDQNQALSCFKKAVSAQPGLKEAARNAARIYAFQSIAAAESKDWHSSLDNAELALKFDSSDPFYRVLRLEAKFFLRDTIGISEELNLILENHPTLTPAFELKAIIDQSHDPEYKK